MDGGALAIRPSSNARWHERGSGVHHNGRSVRRTDYVDMVLKLVMTNVRATSCERQVSWPSPCGASSPCCGLRRRGSRGRSRTQPWPTRRVCGQERQADGRAARAGLHRVPPTRMRRPAPRAAHPGCRAVRWRPGSRPSRPRGCRSTARLVARGTTRLFSICRMPRNRRWVHCWPACV
jgi:hypothetical protein